MSERVQVNTQMREESFLKEALEELGYDYSESGETITVNDGSRWEKTQLVKGDEGYAISGERSNINSLKNKLSQTYAKLVTLDEARMSGHNIVTEETLNDGSIRLVLSVESA